MEIFVGYHYRRRQLLLISDNIRYSISPIETCSTLLISIGLHILYECALCTNHARATNMTRALTFIVFIVSRFCNSWTRWATLRLVLTSKMDFMCRNAACCVVWKLTAVSLTRLFRLFLFVHAGCLYSLCFFPLLLLSLLKQIWKRQMSVEKGKLNFSNSPCFLVINKIQLRLFVSFLKTFIWK